MNLKYFNYIYKYLYAILFFTYVLSILLSILITLIESFSYSGFFLKHTHLNPYLIILMAIISGFIISTIPADNSFKKSRLVKLIDKSFSANICVFIALLIFTLITNSLESLVYNNFVYTVIHLQPVLLYKLLALQSIFLFVNMSLIIREGRNKSKFLNINFVKFLGLKHIRDIAIINIQSFILVVYSLILLCFVVISSFSFVVKFYQPDKVFLKDNELKYALGKIDIYQWIDTFFPQTKDIIKWCDEQKNPVDIVVFDPQIIWLNYEGLTRVFLTKCNYVNIYSLSKTYSYIGKSNIIMASVATCDRKSQNNAGDSKSNFYEYLKVVNNYYICRSTQIVPGLYLYKEGK